MIMLDLATEMLAACVISYAIAVLMPSWRVLLIATLVVLVVTSVGSVRERLLSPAFDACSLGCDASRLFLPALLLVTRAGFVTGAMIRALTFLARARGLPSRSIVTICVAGAALAPAIILFAPDLLSWPLWKR
ncbi:hypothetical protein LQG66_36365 [Bradyrhizobium ontarionense]|uniref:TRAP C4-dicarboxylate transport system permease DctM subunit domain-containing protein n=1 Tax=Bradyrhizobium ontarionense TaxID=2898149 RepID=A0ABY3RCX1_9BRAD|nr:hypothetical protein [Bradyrhizobium sp. A19]UFZ04597.1 hypothetical protein LQG66_36365 [Bradyrhizobium sp. A19]